MMSAKQDTSNTVMCCASCGKAEGDGTQLKDCTACKSVRYCNDTCKENHRPEHEEACKKRAAELRNEILFRQPESTHLGDCPICCLPLPDDDNKYVYHQCCSKFVCFGCVYANFKRTKEERLEVTCPFCRDTIETSDPNQQVMKRIQANDPIAICGMGAGCKSDGNYEEAFYYFSKAAELGHARAHFSLALMYQNGQGVEKDEKKEVYHLEEAAIGGHPGARFLLADKELKNRPDRAIKHVIIGANLGCHVSINKLKVYFLDGLVSFEEFTAAFCAYKAAADAMKSPQRDGVEAILAAQKK